MKIMFKQLLVAFAGSGLLSLYGCGGGSSGPAITLPVVTTTNVPVTVIVGALQNATVCLDVNGNGACDAGEPSGKTDAAGLVNLTVKVVDVGKYPVIAVVGTDAIDADTGPVTVPFTLSAPADTTSVVSPLTTLVQQIIDDTGASTAEATASVQAATGITVSPLQDYTKAVAPTDGSISAATVARMVVVTSQQQSNVIANSVGTTAIDGAIITQADLNLAIQKKLLELLPALVAALSNPTVLAANTTAEKEAALLAAASTLVSNAGLTPTSIATVVAINTQTSSTALVAPLPPSAGFNLANLDFTDLNRFFVRVFTSSLAQNTPDASNNTRFVERHQLGLAQWGSGRVPSRGADLHWNGSAWINCPINFENIASVRDVQGNGVNNCDNFNTGKTNSATFDVSNKTMAAVYNQVRDAGFTNLTVANIADLGAATFPVGSSLFYQTFTPLTDAIAYHPGSSRPVGVSTVVSQYSAAVSAGGVASTQAAGVGCNSTEFRQTNGSNSTTLEGMINAMTGTPCIFAQGSFKDPSNATITITSPDPIDEAWGNSTVDIGIVGTAPVGTGPTPGFYSGNTKLRVAFTGTGANPVTYYACKQRFNNGSTRNCSQIGSGSYNVTTLGDARVLTLNSLPTKAAALNFTRVFVERGGLVYAGFQNRPSVSNSARLNTVGATALFNQLGLPAVDASVPLALTVGSYQGIWDLHDANNQTDPGITIFIDFNGSAVCRNNSINSNVICNLTIADPTTGAFNFTYASSTVNGIFDFLSGNASGNFIDQTATPTTGNVAGHRR